MKIVIGGAGGLIGSSLIKMLQARGDEVIRLVRPASDIENMQSTITWEPSKGRINGAELEGLDAVIHLGGVNIAAGYWTEALKKRLRDSRIDSTLLLADTLKGLQQPPKAFLCASATGIYGDRGDELLDESSGPGNGFLADLARDWEHCARSCEEAGIRGVQLRIGPVLSLAGGALTKMKGPFSLGLGGRLGSGRQYMSWILLEDVVRAIIFCLDRESISGPVNLVAPEPVTNREFTKALGKTLRRPTLFPLPAGLARLILGEMAQELLLASHRAVPKRLMDEGFQFHHPHLLPALEHVLREQKRAP